MGGRYASACERALAFAMVRLCLIQPLGGVQQEG
jgi:hypothetical protein